MLSSMQYLPLAIFILGWLILLFLFGRQFFRALRTRRWGSIILYGIALSFLVSFVEWIVYEAYSLANPGVFL